VRLINQSKLSAHLYLYLPASNCAATESFLAARASNGVAVLSVQTVRLQLNTIQPDSLIISVIGSLTTGQGNR